MGTNPEPSMWFISSAFAAGLVVEVHGARNDQGLVACQIFLSADGFPEEDAKAVATAVGRIQGGQGRCEFARVPDRPYAVAVLHDEDGDLQLDRSRWGLPAEGYAFTNDALGFWSTPPSWEKASVQPGATRHSLRLVY